MIGGERLAIFGENGDVIRQLDIEDCDSIMTPNAQDSDEHEFGRHFDWLDPQTVAFSFNSPVINRTVGLWDIRTSNGVSSRFQLSDRITGISSPANTRVATVGYQLILATNYEVAVYDTRMVCILCSPPLCTLCVLLVPFLTGASTALAQPSLLFVRSRCQEHS